jgi:hypothetical protein
VIFFPLVASSTLAGGQPVALVLLILDPPMV